MRLDKFLKVSRLLKRRTVAKEVAMAGRILVNGREAKPATPVKAGDVVEVRLGEKVLTVEVTALRSQASVTGAREMWRLISERQRSE